MFREARATWKGGRYAGEGFVSTPNRILNNATYIFGSLTKAEHVTSPGELLAAAVSSSMATMVAFEMANLGMNPARVDIRAALDFENSADRWRLSSAQLNIEGYTTSADTKLFEQAIEAACKKCPIASALQIEVTWKANIISAAPEQASAARAR
jgi:organic hydroperoxide reductase OsmC/OhrA